MTITLKDDVSVTYYENRAWEMESLLGIPVTRTTAEWPSSQQGFFWSAFCNPTEKAFQLNNPVNYKFLSSKHDFGPVSLQIHMDVMNSNMSQWHLCTSSNTGTQFLHATLYDERSLLFQPMKGTTLCVLTEQSLSIIAYAIIMETIIADAQKHV